MTAQTRKVPAQRAAKATAPQPLAAVKMNHTKPTKGAVRFDVAENMRSGSTLINVYVRKDGLDAAKIPHTVPQVMVVVFPGDVPVPDGSVGAKLTFTKATPGSIKYDNSTPGTPLSNIYIRKDALNGKPHPEVVTLVVTPV